MLEAEKGVIDFSSNTAFKSDMEDVLNIVKSLSIVSFIEYNHYKNITGSTNVSVGYGSISSDGTIFLFSKFGDGDCSSF